MNIAYIGKEFGFFSQLFHDQCRGVWTTEYRDPRSGEIVRVNYTGGSIQGRPGHIRNGKIERPSRYETYVLVGEMGPGKLEQGKTPWLDKKRPGGPRLNDPVP